MEAASKCGGESERELRDQLAGLLELTYPLLKIKEYVRTDLGTCDSHSLVYSLAICIRELASKEEKEQTTKAELREQIDLFGGELLQMQSKLDEQIAVVTRA